MKEVRIKKRKNEKYNTTSRLLTMREVCQLLHIHSNTLRRWSELGIIKTYRIGLGSHRRFKEEDVVALIVEETGCEQSEHR
jgi:excisionase family DNA binding protein